MASLKLENYATGTLSAPIGPSETAISLTPGDGARFPSIGVNEYFPITLINVAGDLEVAYVTARSGEVLTVTRGQEGTVALSFSANDRVEHRLTAGALQTLFDNIISTASLAVSAGAGLIGYLGAATHAASTVGKFLESFALPSGASLVGFIQSGTGAVASTLQRKARNRVDVFDFMTPAEIADVQAFSYLLDVSDAIQAAANYINSSRLSGLTTSGALSTSYSGTASELGFPKGGYKVTRAITIGGYTLIKGEKAFIKQFTDTEDIFVWEVYQNKISGMQFIGGRYQLDLWNANINSTLFDVDDCQFLLSRNYAINTRATGGTFSHLSASLRINKARFMACNKVLNNCCDDAVIENSWIQVSKTNVTADSAAIMNKGTSVGDPNSATRLTIRNTFMIPDIGVEGVDRVADVRWIDNYGSFNADTVRFGGENGGMSILWQYGAPNKNFPWNTTEAVFKNSYLFCGPDARTDSCVVGLINQIPNRVTVHNCTGPVGKPIIANLSSMAIPAYMTAYELASGRRSYEYFKIDIADVIMDINAYAPTRTIIPNDLYKYLVRGRKTEISKANQLITNGFGTNLVQFDTIVSDNIGAFDIVNNTRLVMPKGCYKMRITVNIKMAVNGAAKTIAATLMTSGSVRVAGVTELRGINADSDRFSFSKEVEGPPGSYWLVNIQHNAAADLNMESCVVDLSPQNFVG